MRLNKKAPQKSTSKVEYPRCNSCKNDDVTPVLKNVTSWEYKGKFNLVKCNNCDLIYLYPRPSMNEVGKYYSAESYWGEDITLKDAQSNLVKEREKTFGSIYRSILRRKKKGKILDIGAGTGIFLSEFKDRGWDVEGVEFSPDAVSFARKKLGITMKKGDFLEHRFAKNSYDVITLNMALEHLYEPLETLKEIHKIMKKSGLLVITVPNIDSVGFKLFKENWQALNLPRHLYQFSVPTLNRMLNEADFKKKSVNHWYWAHNFYTVFESFRFTLSPRFKKQTGGGLVTIQYKKTFSPKKELGKLIFRLLALGVVVIGSLTKKSESITLYAVKR